MAYIVEHQKKHKRDLPMSTQVVEPKDLGVDQELSWTRYAAQYDLMCQLNPAYAENIESLLQAVQNWNLPKNATICDIGAGTGNFISALCTRHRDFQFIHVDSDEAMNSKAREKYSRIQNANVQILEQPVGRIALPENSVDVVLAINSLYTMDEPLVIVRRAMQWLKPSGKFFVIDWGRENQLIDWGIYVFRHAVRNHGLVKAIRYMKESREVAIQNRNLKRNFQIGAAWKHSTDEFRASLESCGLVVEQCRSCYRGYCDMAICSTPINGSPSARLTHE